MIKDKKLTLEGTLAVQGEDKFTVITSNNGKKTFYTQDADSLTFGSYDYLTLEDGKIMINQS